MTPSRRLGQLAVVALALSIAGCGEESAPGSTQKAPAEPHRPPPSEAKLEFQALPLYVEGASDFAFVPGTADEVLVTTLTGGLYRARLGTGSAKVLESALIPETYVHEGCGLLSLAVDPAFAETGFVFLGRCVDKRSATLARYQLSGALSGLPDSESEVMTLSVGEDPFEDWHRWGSMGFEPDGATMWLLFGDFFLRQTSQDLGDKPGSLLRFVPDRTEAGSGFRPALDNPFAADGAEDPSIYAYGLRSPWRGSRDASGRFWVGDVGEYAREELNLVSAPGQNLGWPLHEGECTKECDGLTDPLVSWGRASDEPYAIDDPNTEPVVKRAIWVGEAYEEPAVDRYYGLLDGMTFFGDFFTGWVRAIQADENDAVVSDRLVGHLPSITAFRLGPDGYLYALTLDGVIHRVKQVV
jgi:glucose/arabinose dehydrogenase